MVTATETLTLILNAEAKGMDQQRRRLLVLLALVEDYLGLPLRMDRERSMEAGMMSEGERCLWMTRRRAWLMELAAIEEFLDVPRSVPPKAMRRDGRLTHGVDGRNGFGDDRRQSGPV